MIEDMNTAWCPICGTDEFVRKKNRKAPCEHCENKPNQVLHCSHCRGRGYRYIPVLVCTNMAKHPDGWLEIG